MSEKPVSVITGASRGIGRAIALKLAEENHNLALFGRDSDKLKETKKLCKALGNKVLEFTGDVAQKEFVENSINEVAERFGRIDNLINNAGVAVFKLFEESSLVEFRKQVDTNIYGVYNFTKAVLPVMLSNKEGTIINISSLAGKNGFKKGTMYAATKHAVMGFTKSLMLEVRDRNIRVAAVCPGSVNTEMITNSNMKPENIDSLLTPEDVAETVDLIIKLPANALISEVEVRPANPG